MQNNNDVFEQEFYSLEKHFEIVCNKHPHLKLLESQWRFDQELISKALQNVSSVFPHYSRHDASHSRQIIVNIERLLGDRIKFLSATDTWLILEAAYNHDIGMVITQKQIEDMNTPEFSNFVDSLIADKDNYLRKFAKKWKKNKATLPQKADAHGFFHQYIQLLAEWYRRKHSENSAKIVRNPVGEIGLNSSRNELLPNRLFNVLANICQAHGENFEYILKALPKVEAGMASEDCHPLYVACLLRIADLLDIDDNRFCPVMMSMCGNDLPNSSKTHFDKHHSVRHFRLDSEQIEIECICPTPDSYEVAYDWFEWLKKEYNYQTQNWEKIVPFKELGRLPTLMEPLVKIDEPYLILQEGKKPSFQINEEAIFKLVRGAGLYSSKFDSIREILQNATDATLHRIWLEHKEEILHLQPGSEKLQEIYNKYKIDVNFKPKEGDDKCWVLKVTDVGIGISFEDLKHMLEIGSSFKNKSKQSRLKEMPMWFRPSGAFGIGLQSAYLLANKFTIITRSLIDGQALEVKFNKKKQSVIIKKIAANIPVGTQFIIDIKVKDIPDSISISKSSNRNMAKTLSEYDFMYSDASLSLLETITIEDSIDLFFRRSPITLTTNNSNSQGFIYYDSETDLALYDIEFGDYRSNFRKSIFFRGQPVKDIYFPYDAGIKLNVDFYHTTSEEFLSYNREKILDSAEQDARKRLGTALTNYINKYFDQIPKDQQPFAAIYWVQLMANRIKFRDIDVKYIKSMNNLSISFRGGVTEPLSNILKKIHNQDIKSIATYTRNYSRELDQVRDNEIMNDIGESIFYIIQLITTDQKIYHQINQRHFYEVFFFNYDIQPVTNDLFRQLINEKLDDVANDYTIGCRLIFPAWCKYRKLSIKTLLPWSDNYHYVSSLNDDLVLPIDFKYPFDHPEFYDNSDKFIEWVYENRKGLNITKDEIKELNLALIEHIKSILNQDQENTDKKEV